MAVDQAYMSISQACKYLAKHAEDKKTEKMWFGYLANNSRIYMKQHGYKIVSHVIDGKLCYTEDALKAFIKILGKPSDRNAVNSLLDSVDTKSKKTAKKPATYKPSKSKKKATRYYQ